MENFVFWTAVILGAIWVYSRLPQKHQDTVNFLGVLVLIALVVLQVFGGGDPPPAWPGG